MSAAIMLVIQSVFLVITKDLPIFLWIPCMILAAGFMYLFIFLSLRIPPSKAVYCCACAFLVAELAASLEWQLHIYMLYLGISAWWAQLLLLVITYSLILMIAYFLEKPLLTEDYLHQLTTKELFTAVGIVIFVFAFSNMSFITTGSPFTGTMFTDILNIRTLVDMGGAAVLCAFQSRIGEYMAEKEVTAIQAVLKSQYDQYRNFQDSMELVHIKYHDLKHQIAGLRAETDTEKRKEWLDAMEHELEQNELVNKTGNHVLDTILAAKIHQAKKNDIRITCVADGTLLNFMHVTDICTIFGNALDNARESVVMLDDPEKRLIHVSVSAQKNFVFIQVSNYCEKKLNWESGELPKTTKADKKNHGFGLKSIR